MKKLFVALCVVGCAVASAFGWTVAKVSNAYQAKDESTGLVLNISVLSSTDHTIRFDSVMENPSGVTVLDLTGGFVEEGGTEWTLTQINGSACGKGTASIKAILTEVRLPETLEQIKDNAFANCPNLTKVTPFLPASVKVIQDRAFYKTPVGGDLKLSNTNLTVVGQGCFNCEDGVVCGNLRSVDFTGSGVTEIGAYAFKNATNLTDVILPDGLAKIGIQAFYNCVNLTNVTPFLPPTVTSIGGSAFYMAPVEGDLVLSNPNLTTIESSTFGQTADIAKTIGRLQSVDFTGSGVTQIKSNAFRFQPRLERVVLPDALTTLGNAAFMNCTNLTKVMPFLPASVKEIQDQAFYGSPVGGDLRLSNANLTTIGQNCFNCESGTVRGNLRSIDFTGSGVTEIGAYAFMNATNLTSVILPAMLTKIGGQAFFNCKSLTQVTPLLPDTLWSVGYKAFSGAKIKGDFTMRNRDAVSLPTSAFSGCQFSTIDLLRTSIATIGADAFAWNSELTKVVFPKTLSSLGENAFREATNLRQIYYANDFGVPPFSPTVFTVALSAKFQRIYVPGGSQTWLKYLDEKGCALTDEEKDKFQEDYPGEKLPIGLVPYPRTITGTKLQYLCRWNPEPTGMTVLVR